MPRIGDGTASFPVHFQLLGPRKRLKASRPARTQPILRPGLVLIDPDWVVRSQGAKTRNLGPRCFRELHGAREGAKRIARSTEDDRLLFYQCSGANSWRACAVPSLSIA
jgi:hypothetical protein